MIRLNFLLSIVFPVFVFFATANTSMAAAPHKGDISLQAGLGMVRAWNIGVSESLIPPVFARVNYVLRDDVGPGTIAVGTQLSYDSYKWQGTNPQLDNYGWKQARINFSLIGSYHYYPYEKLDIYGMVLLGWRFVQSSKNGDWPADHSFSPSKSTLNPGLAVGAKYQLVPRWGVFAELGYNTAVIMCGIHFELFQP